MSRTGGFLAAVTVCAGTCFAMTADAGWAQTAPQVAASASGGYSEEGGRLTVSQATALATDNVDGQGDDKVKLRVVLADRSVPAEALMGGSFPPVWAMAKAGKVRGVLLEFDPADRTRARLVILRKPADPAESLETVSLSDSTGLWRSLTRTPSRVSGHFVADEGKVDLTFDVPVATNAIVSDLKGPAAQNSEFVAILRQRTRAIVDGDAANFALLSTRESVARAAGQEIPRDQLKAFAAVLTPLYDQVQRVVVRENTAVIIMPKGFVSSFAREDGVWKCAD